MRLSKKYFRYIARIISILMCIFVFIASFNYNKIDVHAEADTSTKTNIWRKAWWAGTVGQDKQHGKHTNTFTVSSDGYYSGYTRIDSQNDTTKAMSVRIVIKSNGANIYDKSKSTPGSGANDAIISSDIVYLHKDDTINFTANCTDNDIGYDYEVQVFSYNEKTYSHTLAYDANGGTGAPSSSTETNTSSSYSMAVSSTVPTRTGYTFAGWLYNGTTYWGGNSVSVGANATVTLVAQWGTTPPEPSTPESFTIYFNDNGGSGGPGSKVMDGTVDIPSGTPTRDGYTFMGWGAYSSWCTSRFIHTTIPLYASDGTKARTTSSSWSKSDYASALGIGSIGSSVTVYAQWELGYQLEYDGNGATSGSVATQRFYKGQSVNISECNFVKDGYAFAGWNTIWNGTGTWYYPGDSYSGSSGRLYAQWGTPLTLTVKPNGGVWNNTNEDSIITIGSGGRKRINIPTRLGYKFTGWTLEQGESTVQFPSQTKINNTTFNLLDSNYNETGKALYLCENRIWVDGYNSRVQDKFSKSNVYNRMQQQGQQWHQYDNRITEMEFQEEFYEGETYKLYAFPLSKDEVEKYKDIEGINLKNTYTRSFLKEKYVELKEKPEEPEEPTEPVLPPEVETYTPVKQRCGFCDSEDITLIPGVSPTYKCNKSNCNKVTYIIKDTSDLKCSDLNCWDNRLQAVSGKEGIYKCNSSHRSIIRSCEKCGSHDTKITNASNLAFTVECSNCKFNDTHEFKKVVKCNSYSCSDSTIQYICMDCHRVSQSNSGVSKCINIDCRSTNIQPQLCLSCRRSNFSTSYVEKTEEVENVKPSFTYCADCFGTEFECLRHHSIWYGTKSNVCTQCNTADSLVCTKCLTSNLATIEKEYAAIYCTKCNSADNVRAAIGYAVGYICSKCRDYDDLKLIVPENNKEVFKGVWAADNNGELSIEALQSSRYDSDYFYNDKYNYCNVAICLSPREASMTSLTEDAILTMGDADVTLTANWELDASVVNWNPNGGLIDGNSYPDGINTTIWPETSTIKHGDTDYTRIPDWAKNGRTHRTGYIFNGWYDAASDGNQVFDVNGNYTTNGGYWDSNGNWKYIGVITLYAQWTPTHYKVAFNYNGGTSGGTNTALGYNDQIPGLNGSGHTETQYSGNINYDQDFWVSNPSRTGYTFTGWSLECHDTNTAKYFNGTSWQLTGYPTRIKDTGFINLRQDNWTDNPGCYVSFNATWTPNHYNLDINPDYNKYGVSYDNGARVKSFNLNISQDPYTGTNLQDYCNTTGVYGCTYTLSNILYRDGYHFTSYTLRNNANEGTSNCSITSQSSTGIVFSHSEAGNMWLSINTAPNTYTVRLHKNKPAEASNNIQVNTTLATGWSDKGTYYEKLFTYDSTTVPDISFYSLTGWHTDGKWHRESATGEAVASGSKNLTTVDGAVINLYPSWEKNSYTIIYSGNNTTNNIYNDKCSTTYTGTTSSTSCLYDTDVVLAKNGFSKKGYLFKEWNTQSDAKGTSYKEGQKVSKANFTAIDGGSITLYAIWEPITYKIVFNGNDNFNAETVKSKHGGDGKKYEQQMRFDHPTTLLPNDFLRQDNYNWDGTQLKKGYAFIGWGTTKDKNKHDYPDKQLVGDFGNTASIDNLSSTDKAVVNLYALWEKPIELIFNMNGGKYVNSEADIKLDGTIWNKQKAYPFAVDNTLTKASTPIPLYSAQNGKIDAFGKSDDNGFNNKYTKIVDGVSYRFLGWSTDKNATAPDANLNIRNTKSTIDAYDTATLYAVWEPVLQSRIRVNRTLGNIEFNPSLGLNSKTDTGEITSKSTNTDLYVIIKAGEQGQYDILSTIKDAEVTVEFDSLMNKIYNENGVWTDGLNPSTTENLTSTQQSGLDRLIKFNGSNGIIRKFYMPQYLGSATHPASFGNSKYEVTFTIKKPGTSWFYGGQEQIVVKAYICLSDSTGGSEPGPGPLPGTLNELRTRINIK